MGDHDHTPGVFYNNCVRCQQDECDRLAAEVERLRGEIHQLQSDIVTVKAVNLDLWSEVERLRSAMSTCSGTCNHALREALGDE